MVHSSTHYTAKKVTKHFVRVFSNWLTGYRVSTIVFSDRGLGFLGGTNLVWGIGKKTVFSIRSDYIKVFF